MEKTEKKSLWADMPRGMRSILIDALCAGRLVVKRDSAWMIRRQDTNVSLLLYPDGTAFRADVPSSLAMVIRNQKLMRRILGL